jgi:F-type H+-transporting ATPase subunit gamma
MANLKEIRTRIASFQSTMQITSAMKMVSAAKLKRAQDAIIQMRPYANKLQEILMNVSSSLDGSDGKFSQQREVKNVLVISIASNRGLCGAFNNSVVKEAKAVISAHPDADVKVLSISKKTFEIIKKWPNHFTGDYGKNLFEIWNELTFDATAEIAQRVMDEFAAGKWDKVMICYNRFKNAAVQVATTEQLLPVEPPKLEAGKKSQVLDYIFEPSKEFIVEEIIPKSLKVQLFKAMLDSRASEHGARMTAMHKATDNAGELRDDLKLVYNKARQAAITGEILEIVGGAEALKG